MATDVIMPALGMAQDTGKLLRWLRPPGATVTMGEPLMQVETDKVTVEIESPADGVLAAVAAEGDDVPVGQVVARIVAPGESAAAAPRRVPASPKARRIAAERGVSLAGVRGSGPGGAIVAADLEAAPATDGPPELGSTWRTMAERTTASWQSVPHFWLQRDVDASRLVSWREAAGQRPGLEAVTISDLLVRVVARALREHADVNSRWEQGRIVADSRVNVGLAVALDDGLVVPVVHDADRLPLAELVARRRELVDCAREGRLRTEDVAGGTFTISNLGAFGVDAFQAIVNAPQAAILAVGRIRELPVVLGGAIVPRPTMSLTASFDHRAVDGARGARFLETLASYIEEPAALLE